MCGISLLLFTDRFQDDTIKERDTYVKHIKDLLKHRGPDSMHVHSIQVGICMLLTTHGLSFSHWRDSHITKMRFVLEYHLYTISCDVLPLQISDGKDMVMMSSLLQMQGRVARCASLQDDETGCVLLWNGEIYGGMDVPKDGNDGLCLFRYLCTCSTNKDIGGIFSQIRGPWAMVLWHPPTRTLWFGRDVLGRKSLLKKVNKNALIVSSALGTDCTMDGNVEEIPPGLYVMDMEECASTGLPAIESIPWEDQRITDISCFDRNINDLVRGDIRTVYGPEDTVVSELLDLLTQSVRRRCETLTYDFFTSPEQATLFENIDKKSGYTLKKARVMVLFSGGVDSTLVAALLDCVLPKDEPIDLCSICFANGQSPDRLGALDALQELQKKSPEREWRFIEIDSSYEELTEISDRILGLLHPADTVMDFNIGGALWLAARGIGTWINPIHESRDEEYHSVARAVFLGHGADELFGGYGRHRTRFRNHGWQGLAEEIQLDVTRLWKRNFGRDDRLVSDHGKESRLPFMDEAVVDFALKTNLDALVNLEYPPGIGDKIILRNCLNRLGLKRTALRHKRALQFGSRLAKAANSSQFGGTKKANNRSAGSVKLAEVLPTASILE